MVSSTGKIVIILDTVDTRTLNKSLISSVSLLMTILPLLILNKTKPYKFLPLIHPIVDADEQVEERN